MAKRPLEVDLSLPQDVAETKAWLEEHGYRLTKADTTLGTGWSELVFEGPLRVRIEVERGYWNLQAGPCAPWRHEDAAYLQHLMPAARAVAWTDLFPDSADAVGAGVQPRGFRWVEELPGVLAWLTTTDPAEIEAGIARVRAEVSAQHDRESAERHAAWKRRSGRRS